MPETQNIEYKSVWKDEFSCKVSANQTCLNLPNRSRKWCETQYLKWIWGFANAQGGKLYVGKDDNGNVVGIKNAKKLLEELPNKITTILGIVAPVNSNSPSFPYSLSRPDSYQDGKGKALLVQRF